MLDRAITALKSNEATALKEINNANNKEFHDRDLYVSCFNTSDGKFTAFPSPGMIGMDIRTFTFDNDPIGQRELTTHSRAVRIGCQGCGVAYYK